MTIDQQVGIEELARPGEVSAPAGDARSRWAQEVMALARRWWIELLRERLNLVFSIAQPAIWLVFFGAGVERAIDLEVIGTDDYIGFMLAGIIAFTIVGNGVSGAMPLLWDKETGYLDRLMSMPIARSSVIVSRFVFQVAQGHTMFLEELDQVFAGNTAVLGSGDAVSTEPAGIEPLTDSARGHFTDLGDLSRCEDLHRRLSNFSLVGFPARPDLLSHSRTSSPWA